MAVDIEQAREIAADELERQGRTSQVQLIREGAMDDDASVQLALAGKPIPDPWANVAGAGEPQPTEPSFVQMGEVPNVAADGRQ